MRWCIGPCGRELDESLFYLKMRVCKGCHRVRERERYRKNRKKKGFLEARRDRERWHYKHNEEWAEKKRASARDAYDKKKANITRVAASS